MKIHARGIKSFFYSQYFSDGLRMTIGILLPSLVFTQFGYFDLGLTLSLGALCISVIDTPGPVVHKRNAMAAGNLFLLVVAVITGFARLNIYTLGLEVVLFSFLFSMFTVYGNRAAAIGTSALLVMIFMMDKAEKPAEVIGFSLQILAGGLWYMVFSLVFFGIRPYRAAQQSLGENIADIAGFLRIKASFYLPGNDIDENYRKLVSQQIRVSQHQDIVRELLFESRITVRESTGPSRILVLTFVDLVDMFEQIMATHYDYNAIHEKFADSGILNEIANIIMQMAAEVDNIAYMVLANKRYKTKRDFFTQLEHLKSHIDFIGTDEPGISNLVLKKVLINLRDLNDRIKSINNYYSSKQADASLQNDFNEDYAKFVNHQDYAPHVFADNLSFSSAAFKHAIRVSLVCLVGFVTGKTVAMGHHSYWILLTIIVILKPGFSLSKQRNFHRLIGTIFGGIIGIGILIFVPDKTAEFILLIFLMIGTYSFTRLNYVVSILFMTPYVLILFNFLGVGLVVKERIIDTVIGSFIAFVASYLIFPSWEFEQIQEFMRGVINANINYLIKIAESVTGNAVNLIEYKLARKDVFVKSANLSAAFERMTSEPKSKQRKIKDVHKFVVLNHILSSYIATIASGILAKGLHKTVPDNLKMLKRTVAVLNETNKKLNGKATEFTTFKTVNTAAETATPTADALLLKEQFGFINKISNDIARVTDNILSEPG